MNKKFISILLLNVACLTAVAQTTLEQCQQAAQNNYPLIQQRDLIARTTGYTVANIKKGWLPQVSATAQATLQSDVTAWPTEMKGLMNQMGLDMKGLKKDQYRVGIDVNQTIYDGGSITSQAALAREQGRVQEAQNEVNLYTVRMRVNELYFALLLVNEQQKLNNDLQQLLENNEKKLASMFKRGTAAESDYNSVKAERLNAVQQATALAAQQQALRRMLSTLCGIEITDVQKPPVVETGNNLNNRPELQLIDAQLRLNEAQKKTLDAAIRPKLSLFAQGFYGYPGYNMFNDMMHHKWSLNGMIGARLTWNITPLYTRNNDLEKLKLQRQQVENSRDVFLLNNNLDQIQHGENVLRYRKMMDTDSDIIDLRSKVRHSAESKLAHGIIDVNDLIKEINNENAARVQQSIHETEMLKEIYDLKFATNN
ncbi:MAG: TolC family protein [Muribaculaceae bacterium]|nr:TolC family protein [Muribaculaceae bacterium]